MLTYILHLLLLTTSVSMIFVSLYVFFGYEARKNKVPFIIASAVSAAVAVLLIYFTKGSEDAEFMFDLWQIAANMFLPYLLFKSGRKATFALYGFVLPSFSDIIASLISSKIGDISENATIIMYIAIFVATTLLIIILRKALPIKFTPEFLETIPVYVYVIIFIYLFSNYYSIELAQDASFHVEVANILKVVSAILVTVSVVVIVIRYINVLNLQKESEKQLEAEIHHYEDMMRKNSDIRSFRHDYKNNLFSLNALMTDGRTDEAQKYISELAGALENTSNNYQTGNYLADAIISEKSENASKSGTKISFSGTIPKDWIKNNDLCAILSNSLDNAVRACEPIENAVVTVSSKETPNSVVISVANPVTKRVEIKNSRIKTTKSDSQNHGIGLANIERTAKKYNGYMKLSCTDTEFEIKVGLINN